MTLAHAASRPVPRAGAILLVLAGAASLALGGYLAGTAAFGPDDRLVFLRDALLDHRSASVDAESRQAAEIKSIQRRGDSPSTVSRSIDEANRYYEELRYVRDETLRENARRWRRMQLLMGGWMGAAGLGFVVVGVQQWHRARAASAPAEP